MKKILLVIALLATACNHQKTVSQPAVDTTQKVKASLPIDTLQLGNKSFLVYDLDQSPFSGEPVVESDSAELQLLHHETRGHVKREGDSLIITLDNGQHKVFVSNSHPAQDDSYTEYTYTGYIPDIKAYGIYCTYYESFEYKLVDQTNGETISTWGPPIISPNKKNFLCVSYDLEARFSANGFQLFTYQNGKIIPVGETELDNWGPGQVKWIDDSSFIAEHITLDSNMAKIIKPVKMVMQ
jgi:hypothetical protein